MIRIPRMLTGHGTDGFVAIWEAQLILDGRFFQNGFTLFTLLGMTPFSGYPIGFLLILSFFLLISGRNIMIAIILYDLVFTIIFVLGAYYLASELVMKKTSKKYFVLFLTTLPNILTFSYYTSSARYPFFAILPLLFALILKFNKTKRVKNLILPFFIILALQFIHQMAIVLFAIIFLSIFIVILERITKRDIIYNIHNKEIIFTENSESTTREVRKKKTISFLNYTKKRIWILGIFILYAIGFCIFGLNFQNVYYLSKFNVYCYVKAVINSEFVYFLLQPIVDQWFHFGITILLFLSTIIIMLIPKFSFILDDINKNPTNLKLLIFVIPFILIYQLIYSFYFTCYIIALICTILLQNIESKKIKQYLWPITGIIVGAFTILYHFLTATRVLPYLVIGLFIMSLSIIALILLLIQKSNTKVSLILSKINNQKMNLPMSFFFGILIINSMFIVDRSALFTVRGNSIYEHITKEEMEIADFLSENGFGTFDSFDFTVSAHIAALTGWYFIQDQHNLAVFLMDNKSANSINCPFTFFSGLSSLQFFTCEETLDGKQILYRQLLVTKCFNIEAIRLMKTYNLRYFISSQHTNTSYGWQYIIKSDFIESLYEYVPIIKTTENYYVWNTSFLFL